MSISRQNRGAKIAIIGGGAAGFFCGITMREANSNARISIHEKGKNSIKSKDFRWRSLQCHPQLHGPQAAVRALPTWPS